MKKILIVVDMQNDFIDGSLGTKEAEGIVAGVVNKVNEFDGVVLFTKDTHYEDYLDTQEGRNLPVKHCIVNTDGWELCPPLREIQQQRGHQIFEKVTFGSRRLAEYLYDINQAEPIGSIELVGLCTDICVISNALLIKSYLPETPIEVDADCCAGVTSESHQQALAAMEVCQIKVNERDHI